MALRRWWPLALLLSTAAAPLAADPRVTFLTIDTAGDYEQRVASMFPDKTVILENYTGLVSTVDSHPNPASHVFLAAQIIPVVQSRIAALDPD